jgi:hypothetical protein
VTAALEFTQALQLLLLYLCHLQARDSLRAPLLLLLLLFVRHRGSRWPQQLTHCL